MPDSTLTPRRLTRIAVIAALAAVFSLGGGTIGVSTVRASDSFAIVDTLGAATPSTKFDRNDSGGLTISAFQQVGPQFTLTRETVITEIGGFIADGGVFGTAPLVVQIRPSVNGDPDPSTVLGTFELSTDNDPLITSYESVAPMFSLGAGTYYALFAEPQGSPADHFLLCCAFNPFEYRAGSPTLGALCSGTPCQTPPGFPAAVRVLGRFSDDTTPPVLTTPETIEVDATSPAGAIVRYEAAATDDTDPAPTVTCDPPSGSEFPIGTTIVNCAATDSSGNEAHGSFDVHVRGAAEQLARLREAVEGVGPGTNLKDKVEAALASYTAGDEREACQILGAFTNQVKGQSGKSISPGTAASLIADAARIRAVLGC